MAAFASCRRSGWVRLLVVILCALFIFATLGAPPAQALGVESVALFGLASVLSAATAALGFKLASNEQGQATLQKMVQDFKTVAWATGFVLVGSKLNGLQNGMDYIKMQVQNGKTYLDSRVFAWVQQWLAENGVYNSGSVSSDISAGNQYSVASLSLASFSDSVTAMDSLSMNHYGYGFNSSEFQHLLNLAESESGIDFLSLYDMYFFGSWVQGNGIFYQIVFCKNNGNTGTFYPEYTSNNQYNDYNNISFFPRRYSYSSKSAVISMYFNGSKYQGINQNDFVNTTIFPQAPLSLTLGTRSENGTVLSVSGSNVGLVVDSNSTGLSGTDTLGKDVVDLTLDQVLQKLKDWAQDWFDAGADSATNAATGALDLPLTVATGAATANPSIAEDGPLVWFPPFSVPIPNLRTGETDTKTVDQGKENASGVETSTVDVAENQTVIDSLVNWALSYISPDTGLFSKFPLCVPYDAYLLVTSSLGVDSVGSDSIFGASPGDLDGVVSQDIETYSDFQPIINIKHDFELDGKTYPVELTIDLTPWQPLVTFFREGMALLLVAELIGSEFKRIRGH